MTRCGLRGRKATRGYCINKKTVKSQYFERKLRSREHPFFVTRTEIVVDQRQRSLCHALGNGKGHQIDFLSNTHSGDGLVGIAGNDFIQRHVGQGAHQRHNKVGQANCQQLCRNTVFQSKVFRRGRDGASYYMLMTLVCQGGSKKSQDKRITSVIRL